jgi:oligoendopeptidase F
MFLMSNTSCSCITPAAGDRTLAPDSRPFGAPGAPIATITRERHEIPIALTWNLSDIFPDWGAWERGCEELARRIDEFPAMQGTLARGGERLLAALRATDDIGQLAYKVYYFAALAHDQDQRDNEANARKQRVQALLARWAQATSWFNPELLKVPLETVRQWMDATPALGVYRFAIEELYRQQEHVLDEEGERLLSLASRLESAPDEAYEALSTADIEWPKVVLSSGQEITVTYGQYRAMLATNRIQPDRALVFRALHETFAASQNTYAALYNGVMQRDWFATRARRYETTLEAALFGNDVPAAVVENLIETTRAGVEPLQRYHRLRRRALGLDVYHPYDTSIPLVQVDRHYEYQEVLDWIIESVAPLGADYQDRLRRAFDGRWIDVYESPGKRSGAYSAPVYGVHPYMLLNWNHTLDAVFTLAHEMGHSMHTLYSHERQPFVYSGYTIFVAEVPSTLSEALLLDYLLARTDDPRERIVLLTHAIDEIVGTFYTQVMFADYELRAHRLVEQGEPVTADVLGDICLDMLRTYNGDAIERDDLSRITWARIPHFYNSPYYVYQYATCFASTARLATQILDGSPETRDAAVARYLDLLAAGGSDHPMTLLQRAGADLRDPATVQAVVSHLDGMVTTLEGELRLLGLVS